MDLKFLEKLVAVPSPSGFEQPAQKIIRKQFEKYADEVRTDVHGNVIAVTNPGGSPRLMLAAHCDEIGFMVKNISDEGYIYFTAVGGIDISLVPGREVEIHSAKGTVPGVTGKTPVHLQRENEPARKPKIHDFWIDTGAKNRKEAEKAVSIGDVITFRNNYVRLKNNLVSGRSFDDKAGVFVLTEVVRAVSGMKIAPAVFAVSTVQEEVGLRGAATSSYSVKPDAGIAVDVDFGSDYPGMNKNQVGDISLGKGPVIPVGANINPVLGGILQETAKRKKIPFQASGSPRGTGTDANVMQLTRSGVATALVGIPNRYMHTPVEVVSIDDIENAVNLISALVGGLKKTVDFRP